MINNVVKVSEKVFDYFLEKNLKVSSAKNLYMVYFYLNKVIEDSKLVANHYLALTFEEEFLQDFSIGTPQDKWRYFLNKDLDKLNETVKKYLLLLTSISFESETSFESFIYEFYNCKGYSHFIKHQYDIGSVPPCSFCLIQHVLNTNFHDKVTEIYIGERNKIDLSTYEKRKNLKNEILEEVKQLENLRSKTTDYFKRKFIIDDLMFEIPKRKIL